jgi:hypothetical protein
MTGERNVRSKFGYGAWSSCPRTTSGLCTRDPVKRQVDIEICFRVIPGDGHSIFLRESDIHHILPLSVPSEVARCMSTYGLRGQQSRSPTGRIKSSTLFRNKPTGGPGSIGCTYHRPGSMSIPVPEAVHLEDVGPQKTEMPVMGTNEGEKAPSATTVVKKEKKDVFKAIWDVLSSHIHELGPERNRGRRDDRTVYMTRPHYLTCFGWSVPDEMTMYAIGEHVKVFGGIALEIGCGTGLIALLGQALPTVYQWIATDGMCIHRAEIMDMAWTDVERLTADAAIREYPEANCLVTVWPSQNDGWAAHALTLFTQRVDRDSRVVYWGEDDHGCTADKQFHAILKSKYRSVATYFPPCFPGVHDYVEVFEPISPAVVVPTTITITPLVSQAGSGDVESGPEDSSHWRRRVSVQEHLCFIDRWHQEVDQECTVPTRVHSIHLYSGPACCDDDTFGGRDILLLLLLLLLIHLLLLLLLLLL